MSDAALEEKLAALEERLAALEEDIPKAEAIAEARAKAAGKEDCSKFNGQCLHNKGRGEEGNPLLSPSARTGALYGVDGRPRMPR